MLPPTTTQPQTQTNPTRVQPAGCTEVWDKAEVQKGEAPHSGAEQAENKRGAAEVLTIIAAHGNTPGLESAAFSYLEFRRKPGSEDPDSVDSWWNLDKANEPCTQLLRDLHRASPKDAYTLAESLTRLPEVGGDFLGFRLIGELGRGAFGRVYLANQGDLAGRLVALKVAPDVFGESQTLAQLQHTNIVPIYSIHRAEPFQAVCMPYFGSTTLADVLRQVQREASLPDSGKILVSTLNDRKAQTRLPGSSTRSGPAAGEPPARGGEVPAAAQVPSRRDDGAENLHKLEHSTYVEAVLWMAARLADGLAHAHERGIVHRDLKPANILLSDEGQPMLLDFNLSEDTKKHSQASKASIGGTLPYMSPEHLERFRGSARPVDARSDLFSLGVVLFELLAGRSPFPSYAGATPDMLQSMIQDRLNSLPQLRCWNAAVSPAVESIIRHCLEPDPARRYQRAVELREDVERHLNQFPLKYAPEHSAAERAQKWFRRHPRLTSMSTVGMVLGALLLALTVAFVLRGQSLAHLQAVDTLNHFDEEMKTTQFLLYSRNADRQQLEEGMAQCRATLGHYQVLDNPAWQDSPVVRRLPEESRERLRDEVGELLFLLARATSLHAVYHAESGQRTEQLQQALGLNEASATCYREERAPRALLEQRGDLARLLGNDKEAQALDVLTQQLPLRGEKDYYLTAHKHAIAGNYRQALGLLQKATQTDPQNFSAWFVRGNCYYELLRDGEAVACYNTCIGLRPRVHWSWYNRGLAHLRLKHYQQAVEDFDQALALQPGVADTLIGRAFALEGLGRFSTAAQDLTRALDSARPSTRIYFLRAEARARVGDKEGAKADFDKGLEQKPADEQGWIARGLARKDSAPRGALADFEEALKINPRSFDGLQNMAAILVDKFHRDADALRVMDEAVRLYPDSVLTRGGRGVLLARSGKRAAAVEDAEEALLLDTQPATLYQVACIYSLTSREQPEDRLKALALLSSSLRSGFGLDWVDSDTDLDPLRKQPEFRRAVEAARSLQTPAPDPGAK